MGEKLPPAEMELYRRVDEVLHYMWDPIGIAGDPDARDEYRSYLPHVFELAMERKQKEIEDYLASIATERMELRSNASVEKRVADTLIRYRDKLL